VQVDNCNNDLIFRKQYKIRGDAEKQLLDLFLALARQQLQTLPPGQQRETSEDFIRQFAPLTPTSTSSRSRIAYSRQAASAEAALGTTSRFRSSTASGPVRNSNK
jgi:hypothetical protein